MPAFGEVRDVGAAENEFGSRPEFEPQNFDPPPRPPQYDFVRTLVLLTPRVFVTRAILGVNVAVFVVMVLAGVGLFEPAVDDMLRWGANFGPKTIGGEWWRLLTSMFLHFGLMHLAFNMLVLADAGPLVERMVGNLGYALLYLFAGLGGSLASVYWNPLAVSAGASGAIFGIYGALLGLLTRHRGTIPAPVIARLRNSGLLFLGLNFAFGMYVDNIDYAAHLGGLIAGFVGGVVMSRPLTPEAIRGRALRDAIFTVLGAAVVAGGIYGVQTKYAALPAAFAAIERFDAVEAGSVDAFNAAQEKWRRDEIAGPAFAEILERDVLPPWRATRASLERLPVVPPQFQDRLPHILEYMRLRQEAWELYAEAGREESAITALRAQRLLQESNAAAERLE